MKAYTQSKRSWFTIARVTARLESRIPKDAERIVKQDYRYYMEGRRGDPEKHRAAFNNLYRRFGYEMIS